MTGMLRGRYCPLTAQMPMSAPLAKIPASMRLRSSPMLAYSHRLRYRRSREKITSAAAV